VLCHLVDCETRILQPRLKALLQHDNAPMPDVDHTSWEKEHDYASKDPAAKLQEFLRDRQTTVEIVSAAGDQALSRLGIHSLRGPMTFAQVVQYFIDHTRTHIRQIQRTLKENGDLSK
jgi:hypothetical protein